jgi:hypothetical protein
MLGIFGFGNVCFNQSSFTIGKESLLIRLTKYPMIMHF